MIRYWGHVNDVDAVVRRIEAAQNVSKRKITNLEITFTSKQANLDVFARMWYTHSTANMARDIKDQTLQLNALELHHEVICD